MKLKVKDGADSCKAGKFGTVKEINFEAGYVVLSFYSKLWNEVTFLYTFEEVENYASED